MTEPVRTRPTIADVARRAGVSTAAVSFAMNGLPGVASDTRERILRVAEDLGWRPSTSARALRRARAGAVGLVLARDPDELEIDPFVMRFLAGVERTLTRHDCALLLQLVTPPARRDDLAPYERLAKAGRVDGFLVTDPQHDDPRYAMLAEAGIPAVVVGQTGRKCPLPVLETRHVAGMAMAIEHLISLGHERIGFVGGLESHEHVRARRRIWRATLRKAGLPAGPAACADGADPTGAAATAAVLLDPLAVTAIAFTTDMLALTGIAVARELGRSVPGDLSVTGLDDSPLATPSGVTTVRIDYTGLGEGAAAHLIALIDGERPPAFKPAPPELVVRASTARA
jgi:LacI family transcriptional regulator, repressor for deo operon, udp, cdd, tsx, nupC, and nupG